MTRKTVIMDIPDMKCESFNCEDIITKHMCTYCDFTTDLRILLNDHIWSQHKSSQSNAFKPKLKIYSCKSCNFTSFSLLVCHLHALKCLQSSNKTVQNLNGIKWLKCNQCEYKTTCSSQFKKHFNFKHARENLVHHSCDHCSYRTIFKACLQRHMIALHTDPQEINWFQCDQCQYKAKEKGHLKRHIRYQHAAENQVHHVCNHCPYKTVYKDNLKKHVNTCHTDPEEIKWFECDQCGYKTKRNHNLKTHINLKHARENLVFYECSYCSFKTAVKSTLKQHVVIHHTDPEKVKWFECGRCEYKTKLKCSLKKHLKTRHTFIRSDNVELFHSFE